MNKFIKLCLRLSLVFTITGIVAITAAFVMGLNWNQLKEMVRNGEFSIDKEDLRGSSSSLKQDGYNKLDIECKAGTVLIFYDNVDEIKIEQQGIKNFKCDANGDTLRISGGKKLFGNDSDGKITIRIPNGYIFKEIDMEIEAGQADIKDLCIEKFDIEVGAGQAILKNIDVTYMNAKTGAGQIQAELVGCAEDYQCDIECGVGEILIGDNSYSGLGRESHIANPGSYRELDIECGVGQIVIQFQDSFLGGHHHV